MGTAEENSKSIRLTSIDKGGGSTLPPSANPIIQTIKTTGDNGSQRHRDMKTTAQKIKDIVNNTLKYIPSGAYTYQGEGWSHTSGRKAIRYHWERLNVEAIIKAHPELAFKHSGRYFGLQYIDTETDTSYYICIEKASYIGRPDYMIVEITYNWTVSQA